KIWISQRHSLCGCHWRLVRQCDGHTRVASYPWHPKLHILVCFPYRSVREVGRGDAKPSAPRPRALTAGHGTPDGPPLCENTGGHLRGPPALRPPLDTCPRDQAAAVVNPGCTALCRHLS